MTEAIVKDKFNPGTVRLDLIEKGITIVPGLMDLEMIANLLQDIGEIEVDYLM